MYAIACESQEATEFVETAGVSHFTTCISQFPVTITKEQRGSVYNERNFILVHSFRGSMYDQLAELLWACGEATHWRWCVWESEGTYLMAGKQKGKGKGWGPILPFKGTPPVS